MASTTPPPPLTTIFTPAPACSSVLWVPSQPSIIFTLGPTSTPDCVPIGWAPSSYFSPGICPSGYDIASIKTNTGSTAVETAAICCPHGFLDDESNTGNSPFQALPCSSSLVFNSTYAVIISQSNSALTTLSTGTFPVKAYSVQVRWQYTDSAILQLLGTTAAPQPSFKTESPPGQTSTPPNVDAGGLSTGAKIGIGVGVPFVVISLLIFLCIFIFRRRRRGGGFHVDAKAGRPLSRVGSRSTNPVNNGAPNRQSQSRFESRGRPLSKIVDNGEPELPSESRLEQHELESPPFPGPKELASVSIQENSNPVRIDSSIPRIEISDIELNTSPTSVYSRSEPVAVELDATSRAYPGLAQATTDHSTPHSAAAHDSGFSPVSPESFNTTDRFSIPTRKRVPSAGTSPASNQSPRFGAESQFTHRPVRTSIDDDELNMPFYTNPALQPPLPPEEIEDVAALEERMRRVREETERLARLQALREQEERLRARIEARRSLERG